MNVYFQLEKIGRIVPACGEDLGRFLKEAADLSVAKWSAMPNSPREFWAPKVAQIYMLAADAYEAGASASIGHSRSDRYMEQARDLRDTANGLMIVHRGPPG